MDNALNIRGLLFDGFTDQRFVSLRREPRIVNIRVGNLDVFRDQPGIIGADRASEFRGLEEFSGSRLAPGSQFVGNLPLNCT